VKKTRKRTTSPATETQVSAQNIGDFSPPKRKNPNPPQEAPVVRPDLPSFIIAQCRVFFGGGWGFFFLIIDENHAQALRAPKIAQNQFYPGAYNVSN